MKKTILALEDGRVWHGHSFGADREAHGEVCFNTSMTGYQEILTDPSYRGQIVMMTYPLIGNYGTNELDNESNEPHVAGFVVRELSRIASNWRNEEPLDDYLKRHNIPGVCGIDTRAVTRHLREGGARCGIMTTEEISDAAAVDLARRVQYIGRDFVQEVTTKEPYDWDPESRLSRKWSLLVGTRPDEAPPLTAEDYLQELPPVRFRIVAYDFGIKRNILRRLRQHGFQVRVLPASTPASEALAGDPDGIFLSNGPGDPRALSHLVANIQVILNSGKPVFGICLGHQILGAAMGGDLFKLKFGHRGGNQPVKDLKSNRIAITSQNHGFAVDLDSLPNDVTSTHINLNDKTSEGLRHRELPAFSVQYHPEASPGPHDASYFFQEFADIIEQTKS